MKCSIRLFGLLLLVVVAGTMLSTCAWGTYTPIMVDIYSKTTDSCSGTNPFYIHTWMGPVTTGDTYGGIKTLGSLPETYHLKFKLYVDKNPLDAYSYYFDGSPEPTLGIFSSNAQIPNSAASIRAQTKLRFYGLRENVRLLYLSSDGGDSEYYLDEWGGGWINGAGSINVETFYDPYSDYMPYTRYLEIIKDATNYTVNYYDENDTLIQSGTVPIADVFGAGGGDMFAGGDPTTNDGAMQGYIEYLGAIYPAGTYIELEQGWNLVASGHEAALDIADIRFSDDGGATQYSASDAESFGWVQSTLYYYNDSENLFETVPGDASTIVWHNAHWVYADQSGITLVVLW
jgi:hypothetical protein